MPVMDVRIDLYPRIYSDLGSLCISVLMGRTGAIFGNFLLQTPAHKCHCPQRSSFLAYIGVKRQFVWDFLTMIVSWAMYDILLTLR